jgi:hypothetical protein
MPWAGSAVIGSTVASVVGSEAGEIESQTQHAGLEARNTTANAEAEIDLNGEKWIGSAGSYTITIRDGSDIEEKKSTLVDAKSMPSTIVVVSPTLSMKHHNFAQHPIT